MKLVRLVQPLVAATVLVALLLPILATPVAAATFTLSGRVTNSSGAGLAGSIVDVLTVGGGTVIGSDIADNGGNYSIDLSSGTYDVRVTAPASSGLQGALVLNRSITSSTTLDFVLVAAGAITVSGRVLDGQGNGVPNQTVNLLPAGGGSNISAQTTATGQYSIQVAPGDYRVNVNWCCTAQTAASPRQYAMTSAASLPFQQNTTLDLPLPVKRVSVQVVDPAGNPVSNVEVRTNQPNNNGFIVGGTFFSGTSFSGSSIMTSVTNAAGEAVLWLFPTSSGNPYAFTVIPPSGSPFALFNLPNILVDGEENVIVALQFVHAPPFTSATFDPAAINGNFPDDVTATLSATAASGFTVAQTKYRVDGGAEQIYSGPFPIVGDGTHTLTVQSVDNIGVFESPRTFTVVIDDLGITSGATLPSGRNGFAYTTTLNAAGGAPLYNWSLAPDNTLPNGLSLNSLTGEIFGTPTVDGSFSFEIQVTDQRGTTVSKAFTLSLAIGNRPPVPNAGGTYQVVIGQSITLTGMATDADSDPLTYAWNLDNDGQYDDATGQTPTFDASGFTDSGTQTIGLEVCDPYICAVTSTTVTLVSPIEITTDSPLPTGTVGTPYSVTLEAIGGAEPYTWAIASGALPAGLDLNEDTGEISGTPTAAGTFGFTIRVTDSSQITTIKRFVLQPPPSGGDVGQKYPDTPIILPSPDPVEPGEPTPTCTNYVLAPGSDQLPDGMDLDPVTGILRGTPTNGGTFHIVVQCTFTTSQTAEAEFTITINNPVAELTSLDPAEAVEGDPGFTLTLHGTNFVPDSTVYWNGASRATTFVSSTELTALIAGVDIATPDTASVTVVNPTPGGGASNALTFTIVPANLPPGVDANGPYAVDEGESVTLTATGSDPEDAPLLYEWDLDGSGDYETPGQSVAFDASSIDGPATRTVSVRVTDVGGLQATDTATITVNNANPTILSLTNDGPIDEGSNALVTVQVTDPAGASDPLLVSFDCDGDGAFDAAVPPTSEGDAAATCSFADNGEYPVHVVVTDDDGGEATGLTTVVVTNVAPSLTVSGDVTTNEGGTYTLSLSSTDPGDDTIASWTIDWGDGTIETIDGNPDAATHVYEEGPAEVTIVATASDEDGIYDANPVTVTIANVSPTATFGASSPVEEGGSILLSFVDPSDPSDADSQAGFRYAFDCGDGYGPATTEPAATCLAVDDPGQSVLGKVIDKDGGETEYSASVVVSNVAPTIESVSLPIEPNPVSTAVNGSASFNDPGVSDTHTATWNWGDGSATSTGSVTEQNGSGTATGSHVYATAGVYRVTLEVCDDDGGCDSVEFAYVVIYDSSAGFVTGGGWIDSPAGAYAADPSLTGKASFGFVARYKKGATVPDGNTEFQFKAGDLNFKSVSYDWLVVAGAKAKFKGIGTINGSGNYGFMLTAIDGQLNGGGADKFRIKIWDIASGQVVYDNQMGASDDADAATSLGGGSIVVHK